MPVPPDHDQLTIDLTDDSVGDPEALIDIKEVARRLGVGVRYVRRLVDEHRVTYYKLGGLLRFKPCDVDALVERSRVDARW